MGSALRRVAAAVVALVFTACAPQPAPAPPVEVATGRVAKDGDHVSVHCVGTLADGTVFESSRVKKRPLLFVAGGDKVVVGLSQGVIGMKVGGHRTLTVPPALGYGSRGSGKKVPPGATLVFDVELLSVK